MASIKETLNTLQSNLEQKLPKEQVSVWAKRAVVIGMIGILGTLAPDETVTATPQSSFPDSHRIFLPLVAKGPKCPPNPNCEKLNLETFSWLSGTDQTECCNEAPYPWDYDNLYVKTVCHPNPDDSPDKLGDEFECKWTIHAGQSSQ